MIPSAFSRRLLPSTVAGLFLAAVAAAQEPTPPAGGESGVQELTRGPVHEAFGQPSQFNPQPGEVVAKAPPEAVEELPPDQKPEGDDVRWIPGYWHFDDEAKDFMWVSGFWRNIPPGRTWVPGYWNKTADGHQWVSGFWSSTTATEAVYLPAPPETLEAGPAGEMPAADNVWMSGVWMWRDTRYLWRPGYWSAGNPNWVWSAPHYDWTPNGYMYVDGYWDYPIQQRGLLFAPVIFGNRLRPGFVYTPSVYIDPGLLALNLFARPRYGHYYFGDYYAANYASAGIYPWFAFSNTRLGYDPLYNYTAASYASTNPNWQTDQRAAYYARQKNADARPPRTFAAQRELAKRADAAEAQNLVLARALADVSAAKTSSVTLVKVDATQAKAQQTQAVEYRKLTTERVKSEPAAGGTARTEPARVKWTAPASVAAPASVKAKAPPAAPKQPEAVAHDPATAKPPARTLPRPEDVLKPDFTRPNPGREPTPKDPTVPKNPLPKEPVVPKNPPVVNPPVPTPKTPAPAVTPPVPKNPAPKPKGNPKDKD